MPAQPLPEALTIHGAAHASTASIEADFWAERAQVHWLDALGGLGCTMTTAPRCLPAGAGTMRFADAGLVGGGDMPITVTKDIGQVHPWRILCYYIFVLTLFYVNQIRVG